MTTLTDCARITSVHTGRPVRPTIDPATGWCPTHQVRTYRDGIDWLTDTDRTDTVLVLDDTHARARITGRVTVTCPLGVTDRELAEAAGYGTTHHGWDVTRYDDGTAVVSLWND